MKKHWIYLLLAASTALASVPVAGHAQGGVEDRVERMERDLMILQRQFYRQGGGTSGSSSSSDSASADAGPGAAGLSVRISQLEQQMRELTGLVEKTQFQNQQLSEKMDKMSADTDYRLKALEGGGGGAAAAVTLPAASPTPAAHPARADRPGVRPRWVRPSSCLSVVGWV